MRDVASTPLMSGSRRSDQRHVRTRCSKESDAVATRRRLADQLQVVLAAHDRGQAGLQQRMVVDDEQADTGSVHWERMITRSGEHQ